MNWGIFDISLCILISWVMIYLSGVKFSFIHISLMILSLNLIGIYAYGNGDTGPTLIFALGMLSFAWFVFLSNRFIFRKPVISTRAELPPGTQKVLSSRMMLLIILVGVVGYSLFALKGIPLFANHANTYRETVGSGLGIEDRFLREGLPCLLGIIGVYYLGVSNPIRRVKYAFYIVLALYTISAILLGNKSAGIAVVETIAIILTALLTTKKPRRKASITIGVISVFGILTGVYITETILHIHAGAAWALIVQRATVLEGMGFYDMVKIVVPTTGLQLGMGQYHSLLDLLATFRLYPRGLNTYSLLLEVAYIVQGTGPSSPFPVFPITITPFGDFYFDFGTIGVVVGAAVLGVVFAAVYKHTLTTTSLYKKSILVMLQIVLAYYVDSGGLVTVLNLYIIPVVFLALVWGLAQRAR